MPRRRYPYTVPTLIFSFLFLLMTFPASPNRFFNFLRVQASAAATFTVNSTGDGGDINPGDGVCNDGIGSCTLRAAIQEANALAGDDGISFNASLNNSTITLNTALPEITGNLNITGPGATLLRVQRSSAGGTPNFRIVAINSGPTVTISGLTITNGLTASSLDGGGIFNGATLTLTDVTVNGNQTSATPGSGGWGGGISNGGTLTLNNCTISNNKTAVGDAGGLGGGILNLGTMTLNNSVVSYNQTGISTVGSGSSGAGIFNQSGNLILNNSTVSGNQTGSANNGGLGGGIFNTGNVTLTNSHIDNNLAFGNGGAISNYGSLILITSTVSGNRTIDAVFGAFGGGIYNHITATVTLTNSTLSNNRTGNSTSGGAGGYGGGVYNLGTMTVTGSTISDNQTGVGIMVGGYGGGVFNTATLDLTNSTVSGNRTGNAGNPEGGGIQNTGTLTVTNGTITNNTALGAFAHGGGLNNIGGTINLQNTIVAGNFRVNNTIADDISGIVDANSSFNLIGTGGSGGLANGINNNQVGVADPRLGPLANNGDPTLTHALLSGSVAIDAGNSSLTTDQRGQPRPVDDQTVVNAAGGNGSDIGAYEAHTFEVNSTADTDDGLCRALGTGNGCTLREAINAANAELGAELITFAPALTSGGPATISLLTALADLSSDLTISGSGAALLTVRRSNAGGTPNFSVFHVTGGTITIAGLTISNGNLFGILNNQGTLTVSNCIIDGNNEIGIMNGQETNASLIVNDSTISNHTVAGIWNSGNLGVFVTAKINNSTISGNGENGILNHGLNGSFATLTVNGSTLSGNNSGNGSAGGLDNRASQAGTATATINNSTISGNHSTEPWAGGISVVCSESGSTSSVTLNDSTVSGNFAPPTGNGSGGINVVSSNNGVNAFINLRNTIVAGNIRTTATTFNDISGAVDPASSFNLIGDGSGMTGISSGANGNQIGTSLAPIEPRLGSLANNGGPTQTHALLPGSPALDAGSNGFVVNPPFSGPPFTDQRGTGFARIVDGPDADTTDTVDIGAFEAQVSVADIADQTINEDGSLSLPFNVGGTAAITSVTATSSNTALVPNNPLNIAISSSGSSRTLVINPVANASGTSTITVTVNGSSQTMTDTFLLTVNSVNDAPSFTKGPDQTVNENDGAQTFNNWATIISAGPTNELGQTLAFIVTNNSNSALFAVAPAISSTGTLTYTPATGFSGIAQITIALMDNGGTANGGLDTSATQSFNINVLEGGTLAFSSSTYSVGESAGNASITITRSGGSAGIATVLFATSNGTATSADYTTVSQTITFNDGETSKNVSVPIVDDLFKEADETVNLTLSNAGGSGQLGAQATAVLTILDNDPVGGYIRFSSATFNTTESSGSVNITVERVGDTTQLVTVNYATAEDVTVVPCGTVSGIASSRCDFTTTLGTLRFAAGETSKTFAVLITQDSYVEGPESLIITLSNVGGGALLATPSASTLTITDDAAEPATNPIDDADVFVRQHYHDFLNREPDAAGLAYWANQITECQQPGATCDPVVRRINVSAAFFLSIEFQETGYLVERIYKSAYGDADALSALDTYPSQHPIKAPIIKFNEFLADTQQISKDVVVGVGNWQAQLENNKVAFTQDFVARSRFIAAYPTTMTPAEFVDALFVKAVVTPSDAERTSIINEFGGAGTSADTAARARALRRVAENTVLKQQEINKAFVLMQYFGYLRRDPDAAPDTDHTGYDFWLTKLNDFNGNFISAEMVKAFIESIEYRQRFGP